MKVRDIMTKSVTSISPEATVKDAAQLMQRHNVGSIPVVDANGLVGIVTDRDIVIRNIALGQDPYSTPVIKRTSQSYNSNADEDVNKITQMMSSRQIRRIPVVENQNSSAWFSAILQQPA